MRHPYLLRDAMSDYCKPGAKAGNPFIDINDEEINKYEPLRKILEFCLIDTLEKIIKTKNCKKN